MDKGKALEMKSQTELKLIRSIRNGAASKVAAISPKRAVSMLQV